MTKWIFLLSAMVLFSCGYQAYKAKNVDLSKAKVIDKTEACVKGKEIDHCISLRILEFQGKKYLELKHNLYGYFGKPTPGARLFSKYLCDLSKKGGRCLTSEGWTWPAESKPVSKITLYLDKDKGKMSIGYYEYPYKFKDTLGKVTSTVYIFKDKAEPFILLNSAGGCVHLYELHELCFSLVGDMKKEAVKFELRAYKLKEKNLEFEEILLQKAEGKWLRLGDFLRN